MIALLGCFIATVGESTSIATAKTPTSGDNSSSLVVTTTTTPTLNIRPLTEVYGDGPPQVINITNHSCQLGLYLSDTIDLRCGLWRG